MSGTMRSTSPTLRYITTTVSDGRIILKTEVDILEEEETPVPAPPMDIDTTSGSGENSIGIGNGSVDITIKVEEESSHENVSKMATSSGSVAPNGPNVSNQAMEMDIVPSMEVSVPDEVMPSMPESTSTSSINNCNGRRQSSQEYSKMIEEVDSFLEEIFSLDEYSAPPISVPARTSQEQIEVLPQGPLETGEVPVPIMETEPSEPSTSSAIVRETYPSPIPSTSTSVRNLSPIPSTSTPARNSSPIPRTRISTRNLSPIPSTSIPARNPSPIPSTSTAAQSQNGVIPRPPQVVDSDAETEMAASPIPTPSPRRKPKSTPRSDKTISKKPKKKTKPKPSVSSKNQDTSGSKTKPVKKIDLPRVTKDKRNQIFSLNPIVALLPRRNAQVPALGAKIPDAVFAKCFNMARKKPKARRRRQSN